MILCYHALSSDWPQDLAVDPREFERQLRLVSRFGYDGSPLADTLARPRRRLHVTFDDGYESTTRAVPVLERLRIPATLFVCPAYIDGGRIADAALAADAASHPHELRCLSWDSLRELSARGHEIGSHSMTHARLTQTTDEGLRRQLVDSKARIEAELGRPCRYLSYPNADQDERVRGAARTAGYDAAFVVTRLRGVNSRYAVPRIGIYRKDGRLRFGVKALPFLRGVGSSAVALRRGPRGDRP